jgi:hypothetical protein
MKEVKRMRLDASSTYTATITPMKYRKGKIKLLRFIVSLSLVEIQKAKQLIHVNQIELTTQLKLTYKDKTIVTNVWNNLLGNNVFQQVIKIGKLYPLSLNSKLSVFELQNCYNLLLLNANDIKPLKLGNCRMFNIEVVDYSVDTSTLNDQNRRLETLHLKLTYIETNAAKLAKNVALKKSQWFDSIEQNSLMPQFDTFTFLSQLF